MTMGISDEDRVDRLTATGISEVRAIILVDMVGKLLKRRITTDHAIAVLEEAGWPVRQAHALVAELQKMCVEHGVDLRDEAPDPVGEALQGIGQVST